MTLLDIPGDQDVSDDTCRTLLAVDRVVMAIDAAQGEVSGQARRLSAAFKAGSPLWTIFATGSSKAVSRNRLLSDAIDPGRIAADLSAFPPR